MATGDRSSRPQRGVAAGALLVVALLVPAAQPTRAALAAPFMELGSQAIAPGVTYRWGSAQADNGPQVVHVAQVDPAHSGIGLRVSLPRDKVNAREKTTAQALRHSQEGRRVVAAINGPTFNSYPGTHFSARGLNVQDGAITSLNVRGGVLSTFAVDSQGRARIGIPDIAITVTVPGGGVGAVHRINAGRLPAETSLFTPRFDSHTWTGAEGDEYVIEGVDLPLRLTGSWTGTVAAVNRGMGDTTIMPGQVVLSASSEQAPVYAGLQVGDQITITSDVGEAWRDTVSAIGAKQLIVADGQVDIRPYDLDDITNAHPRSVLGVTAGGDVLMVAVEGRSTTAAGLKLEDLARLMVGMGAVKAINLDGGGSTTLALRKPGDVEVSPANALSGGGSTPVGTERTVSNTLQVVSTYPTGPITKLLVAPAEASLPVGESLQYTAKGHDEHFNGVQPAGVEWHVGAGATISAAGLLTGDEVGRYTVEATAGRLTATGDLTVSEVVVPVTAPPTIPPDFTATPWPNRYVKLAWGASSASVEGTIVYRVFRDGVAIGKKQTGLKYTDRTSVGEHSYQVRAIDAAGRKGELSTPLKVTVFVSSPPTVPTGLAGVAKPKRYVALSWSASTATVSGTILYRLFRDGVAIGQQQPGLTYTDRPTAGAHSYQVRAIDAAGQKSALSPPITVVAAP